MFICASGRKITILRSIYADRWGNLRMRRKKLRKPSYAYMRMLRSQRNHSLSKSSKSQAKINTSLKYKKIYFVPMTLRHPSCHRRPIAQRDCFTSRRLLRRWHFPLPLGRRWEYHTSAGGAESMMPSACAESIILSAPPAKSMMLSAWEHACALLLREYHTLSKQRWLRI